MNTKASASPEPIQPGPDGLLPDGVHDLSIDQVEELFGQFQGSDRRPRLMRKLRDFLAELARAGWPAEVIVDGSFVMASIDGPEDIDLVVVMPEEWTRESDLKPFEYNLVSKRRVKSKFGFDVFAVPSGSEAATEMIDFFSQINTKWFDGGRFEGRLTKGLVRITA